MAKKKYYAVKIGRKTGIYETWEECEMQVKGISGAQYKSFSNIEDAQNYIINEDNNNIDLIESTDSVNLKIEQILSDLKKDEIVAFVDGSYSNSENKSGFGVLLIDSQRTETPLYKSFNDKKDSDFIELRNVAAELEGVKEAISWAIEYKKSKITIYYDYEGIGKWANGSWKPKKKLTCEYVKFLKNKQHLISINFIKVPAHSGIIYNEKADTLAKRSLLEKGYKTYNDGSIYFLGFSVEDWETIINCLNEENGNLNQIDNTVQKSVIETKTRLVVSNNKEYVIINCYNGCRSYVQGKQSVLFQKLISYAIELMSNEQTVLETLNHLYVLMITKDEVELKFEKLLPNYNGKRKEKHYNNLLSAVYNTMLVGYMPDYTFLLTPIFRSYEYYLHRILQDKMGLTTTGTNGKNNFSYFNKQSTGRYVCSSSNISQLNDEQATFLNDLYNKYNQVRHPYTHWSADDYDTAVITDIQKAKDYIFEGLTLINKYYILF